MNRRRWKNRYEKAIVFSGCEGTGSVGFSYHPVGSTRAIGDRGHRGCQLRKIRLFREEYEELRDTVVSVLLTDPLLSPSVVGLTR
jgi:hypothetical protein